MNEITLKTLLRWLESKGYIICKYEYYEYHEISNFRIEREFSQDK